MKRKTVVRTRLCFSRCIVECLGPKSEKGSMFLFVRTRINGIYEHMFPMII